MTTVLFFARARELAGAKSQNLAGDTVSEVLENASRRFGSEFAELLETCTVMVDDDVVRRDQHATHTSGDLMAVLPPVSGGSEDLGPTANSGGHDNSHHDHDHGCEPHEDHGRDKAQLRVAILTVSDRASVGTYEDRTGPAIEATLAELGAPRSTGVTTQTEATTQTHVAARTDSAATRTETQAAVLDSVVLDRRIVADERDAIAGALIGWCDSGTIDLVLTNGGTGLSPRDVTPEVTREILDVEAPGIAELMRSAGLRSTPLAALSRQVVGRRGNTIVVNLPGSTRGAVESLEAIASILPHACLMARTEVW
ncbi:MAG: molybdenum cofactor synthesis domain-containing protein [Microthrixaceae bacterium]